MPEYILKNDALAKVERVDYGGNRYRIIYAKDLEAIPAADVVKNDDDLVRVVRCINCRFGLPLKAHADCVYGLNCSIGRGEEVRNVWHKYSKHYEDYSLVDFDGFCDQGEEGQPEMDGDAHD